MNDETPKERSAAERASDEAKDAKSAGSKGLDSNGDEYGSLSSSEMRELIDEVESSGKAADARLREMGIIP